MQKCYNCGKEVSDETLICPECGALVKRYTTPAPRLDEQPEEPERGVTDDGYASMFRDRPNRPSRVRTIPMAARGACRMQTVVMTARRRPGRTPRRRRGDSRSIPSARTEASGATNEAACTSARG
mgnify:CR=1 FL=1